MKFFLFIAIIITICIAFYLAAIIVALCYEMRMRRMYSRKKQEIARIEVLPVSLAVKYAKRFKVEADYQKMVEKLENKRLFISNRILHVRKHHLAC